MTNDMKKLRQCFNDMPVHTKGTNFKQVIYKEDSDSLYEDVKKLLRFEIEQAYICGYERGHDDTVESCYGNYEEKAEDYANETLDN